MVFRQFGLLIVALFGLAACATGATPVAGKDTLKVVSTLNVWGSLADQLGGDRVRVTVVDTGADPHDYEPTAQDARAIAAADLVLRNGIGYDEWAGRLLDANPVEGRAVLDVGSELGLPADGNPHQWNDPDSVHRVVDAITARYIRLRPADAGYFTAQHDRFVHAGLSAYDAAVTDIRTRFAGTPVGASESLLVPLSTGLHLRMLTPAGYLDAEHDEAEPSAADVAATEAQLTGRQVAVWMYDARSTEPQVLRLNDLARAAGVPVVSFTEAIPAGDDTFQDWQTGQLTALATALAQGTS
ncbi:metal ABC transporter solute-binding protein, Zn/Mn family [Pseudonocardia dioxanivorans]|uniref:metal ABC transporter solute-binding protein, Zn/Mn family n=1 Tax=Pseudonocardia dioxanivorans TaxID=240495 RepID=UPI000CD20A3A|nr:zinc ABC transporter substrate-binding protein [Pseudonocardia dioxanivorans]